MMQKRVLVVDDDLPTRQMIAAVLSRASFAVDVCENGEQAFARMEQEEYGAIVLALVQSDIPGDLQLFRRLDAKYVRPCVVVISAGSQATMDAIDSEAIRARLRKPFQIDELVGAVTGCFPS